VCVCVCACVRAIAYPQGRYVSADIDSHTFRHP